MRVEQVLVEVFACTGPHYRDHDHGLSLTAFSRHLSDQPFPPLAVRDASPKHGLPEPCLSMPATGSRKAPRVSPFRSGCGRNDAAKEADGDGRGRIFLEVTEKDGGVARSCPRLSKPAGERATGSGVSTFFLRLWNGICSIRAEDGMSGIPHIRRHPRARPEDPTTSQSIETLQMLGTGPSMTEARSCSLNEPMDGGRFPHPPSLNKPTVKRND